VESATFIDQCINAIWRRNCPQHRIEKLYWTVASQQQEICAIDHSDIIRNPEQIPHRTFESFVRRHRNHH
jgi:hypothetical protein